MNLSLYVPGDTMLHRMPAGAKYGALFAAGFLLFLVENVPILAVATAVGAVLLVSVRAPLASLARQLRGVLVMLTVFFLTAVLFQGTHTALVTLFRLLALTLLALSVTLTTRVGDLLEFFEQLVLPLARVGLANPARIGLSVSLALRFIPDVFRHYHEIREAQTARGLRSNPVALVVPLVVRTLKAADDIAAAIDARCYHHPSLHVARHTSPKTTG